MKKFRIIAFLIIIMGLTGLSMFKSPTEFSEKENRYLATKPELSVAAVFDGSFESEYEEFITDQFVWRDKWIGLKTYFERVCLKQEVNSVFFCEDGYYMTVYGAETFETGTARNNYKALNQFIEKYSGEFDNLHFQMILVPTASGVLTDKLPAFVTEYDEEAVCKSIAGENGEYVLDALSVLSLNTDKEIYYHTDHHWTQRGAKLVYDAWCEKTGRNVKTEEEYRIETASEEFYGTLDSKVNISTKPDTMLLYHSASENEYTVDIEGEINEGLYYYGALDTKDKYVVYLGGNHPVVRITCGEEGSEKEQEVLNPQTSKEDVGTSGRKLLVIKDSYAHSFVPFTADDFDEIVMIDLRYYNGKVSELIASEQITDIIVLYNVANIATDRNILKILN